MQTPHDTKTRGRRTCAVGFGQRRHACKIVNLRQPNLSWLEGQGRTARAMAISVSLLGMALRSRPGYACSCIPVAIRPPGRVDTSITDTWVACWGRNTETPPPKPRHRLATNMSVRADSWYTSSTMVVQVRGIIPPLLFTTMLITKNIQRPASATARTHARTTQEKRFRSPLRRKAPTPHP